MCVEVPEWLQNKAEMILMVEMTIETKAVKLILGVGIIQTLQKLQLLQASLVPKGMNYMITKCMQHNMW